MVSDAELTREQAAELCKSHPWTDTHAGAVVEGHSKLGALRYRYHATCGWQYWYSLHGEWRQAAFQPEEGGGALFSGWRRVDVLRRVADDTRAEITVRSLQPAMSFYGEVLQQRDARIAELERELAEARAELGREKESRREATAEWVTAAAERDGWKAEVDRLTSMLGEELAADHDARVELPWETKR